MGLRGGWLKFQRLRLMLFTLYGRPLLNRQVSPDPLLAQLPCPLCRILLLRAELALPFANYGAVQFVDV